ncbi:pentatricopeptide repeat-containing protein [Tanacetum coccineum]
MIITLPAGTTYLPVGTTTLPVGDAKRVFQGTGRGERYGELEYYDWGLVKVNRLSDARGLFDEMLVRDMVSISWNTILEGGYCKSGDMVKSMVSWTIILAGYAAKGLAKWAK